MNIQTLDTQLLLLINHTLSNPLFDVLMPMFSYQGYLLVIPFLFYIIIRAFQQRDGQGRRYLIQAIAAILIACCAVYTSDWIEYLIKDAVARVRPCRAIEGIRLITSCPKSYSLPSGHAMSSFTFATTLFYLTREYVSKSWRAYPLVLAALIAFSRPYLGVHYPTDILAGALLGAFIGLVLSMLYQVIRTAFLIKRS